MEFPWLKSGLCLRTRDRLLDGLGALAPSTLAPVALPAEMERHLQECSSCRTLAASVPAIARWSPHWTALEPPAGLAQQTALRLQPFWTVRERAVNRQEIRMIWSSGLALAATSAVAFLLMLDGVFPISATDNHHPLVQVGLLLGATQLIGGGFLSLTLLALDMRRRQAATRAARAAGGSGSMGGAGEGGQA